MSGGTTPKRFGEKSAQVRDCSDGYHFEPHVAEHIFDKAVFILGDEAETNLNGQSAEQRQDADSAEGIVADALPASAQIAGDLSRSANETGEACSRAADEAPQKPENEQGQDRDSLTRCANPCGGIRPTTS